MHLSPSCLIVAVYIFVLHGNVYNEDDPMTTETICNDVANTQVYSVIIGYNVRKIMFVIGRSIQKYLIRD
jgi:hypothetical protein